MIILFEMRYTTGEATKAGLTALLGAELNETNVKTHIGILHEKGY
jgi:hypothetical protein